MRPSFSIALIVFETRGADGLIFPSHFRIDAGISTSGASGEVALLRSSKVGKASRLIKLKKAASMTVVVRLHRLSLPLRSMVARLGESM